MGVVWGWYILLLKWVDLWLKVSMLLDYNFEDILKFVIIMIDGDFNRYYYKRCFLRFDCWYYVRWYIMEICRRGRNDYWFLVGFSGFNG